jgi:rhamnose utilization protein RhaD (predicted bifunctional aldolase and dehydrogenase)/NAD(P)-dependent dehydrogenase (short-subunit alcohol dehydrogenase family)
MKSRWSDADAREAIDRWGGEHGEDRALRLYTARLVGSEPDLVLHGGGNVSVKSTKRTILGDDVPAIYVKGSGWDMASLEPQGLPGMDLDCLTRLRTLESLDDEAMVNEIRTHLFDASAPTPSIETLVHTFLAPKFIDHSHADAVLVLANLHDGETIVREALGDRVAILPYIRPGFELAKACADLHGKNPNVEGIVLLHHGLFTFGEDARTSYERHIALVDVCEGFAEKRAADASTSPAAGFSLRERAESAHLADADARATRIAPLLRGLLAPRTGDEDHPHCHHILEWRANGAILAFLAHPDAKALAETPPLTGDHVIRTKPKPLFISELDISNEDAWAKRIQQEVAAYAADYRAYVQRNGAAPDTQIDALPLVVLLPGAGMFCRGATRRDARIAADIMEHTLSVKRRVAAIGRYEGLSEDHIFDFEFRAIQRAKLRSEPCPPPVAPPSMGGGAKEPCPSGSGHAQSEPRPSGSGIRSTTPLPLAGRIVTISGGAGAIGSAVADTCAGAGAHVAISDLDPDRIKRVVERINRRCGDGVAIGVEMDVTDEASVRNGYATILREFGGVDVIVPNAGIAHVAAIDALDVNDFRRVMEINTTGYLLFMQEGIRILKKQGLGGHVILNTSKNVFAPGKDFAAYSASKAAAHQLGKVAAIELAPFGIRVNMINADAIFSHEDIESGLWAQVGPERMKSRGLEPDELIEYYRGRNLLKARIRAHHVGNAVVFFASNATPTTGATLPVDGGVIEAFPR